MCRTHSYEELATIMDNLSGLFTWKRRRMLAASADIIRTPSRGLRHPALDDLPGSAPEPELALGLAPRSIGDAAT